MEDNTFALARQVAQELVRNRVEPADIAQLLNHMLAHQEGGDPFAFLRSLASESSAAAVGILENTLQPLQDKPEEMVSALGWTVDFMRYYRGEGNRPSPERRATPVRRERTPRAPRQAREPSVRMDTLDQDHHLTGKVRSVMPYGIFVDVGAERDGLVHISEMSSAPETLSVGDAVDVWVKSVDLERKRISLTMRNPAQGPQPATSRPAPQAAPREAGSLPAEPASTGAPTERRSRPPRRSGRRHEEGRRSESKFYEDEVPKEMTALGEALAAALAAQSAQEEKSSQRRKKQGSRSEELAEAHRRTLYQ